MQLPFWHKISLGARLISHLHNGLSQPHFRGFFSPQARHQSLLEPSYLFAGQSIQYIQNIKNIKSLTDQVSLWFFFCAIHIVWIQEMKEPMTTIKVMTENWAYCGFQGWLQTEKMVTCQEQSTLLLVILHGKYTSSGFLISILLINYFET